ncbi:DNA polymerase III subunit delta [Anaerolineales bacterium HSG6]|nr:DNA polymerase III subunit delta [Anaerolineales bacterium HSG6]
MIYLFHGPDDFTRSEKIAKLKASMGDPTTADLNITMIEGRKIKLNEIQYHASAVPFLASKRLILVRNYLSQLGRKAKEVQPVIDMLDKIAPVNDLVFVEAETLDKRHPILKVKSVKVVSFNAPSKKGLPSWISKRVQKEGGSIKPDAADMLARLAGSNLHLLNNEIEKLLLYVNGQRPIGRKDVELLVPYIEEAENFGFSNALGQRNARMAYDQLHKMLEEGRHPMAILAAIATQIRGLLEVKDMHERGMNARAIAQAKGWRSDFAAKARLRDARNFSIVRLEQTLEALLETDLAIKTGRIDAYLALDILIGQLCGPTQQKPPSSSWM